MKFRVYWICLAVKLRDVFKKTTVIEQRDAVTILKIILLGCFYTSGITDSLSSLFFLL